MNKNKIMATLLAFVMMLSVFAPSFAYALETAPAAPAVEQGTKKVILHKILQTKENLQNQKFPGTEGLDGKTKYNGTKIDEITGYFGADSKEIEGVFFAVKNAEGTKFISKEGTELDEQFVLSKDTQSQILGGLTTNAGLTIDTSKLKQEPPTKYKIVEVKELSTYKGEKDALLAQSKAVPVDITLPLVNEKGVVAEAHVYPKNTEDKPEIDKTVGDLENKYQSNEIGKTITWYLQATAPSDIKDYKIFKLTDKFDKALSYKGNVKVKYGTGNDFNQGYQELTKTQDYTLTEPEKDIKGGDLKIELTAEGIKKLTAGQKVVASVETVINEDAIMGKEIPNDFTLEYGHNPDNTGKKEVEEPKKPKVVTGGKKFKKISKSEGSKGLEDAIFQLYDGDKKVVWTEELLTANKTAIEAGQFATKEDESYKPTSKDNIPKKDQEIYLRSKADGTFEIKGLEYSSWKKQKWDADQQKLVEQEPAITHDWKLKEVKAPEGYATISEDIGFTIDRVSYYQGPIQEDLEEANPQEINNKKISIPQTGGIGTVIFTVAGLAIMGGAFYVMKKNNEEEEA